MRLGVSPLLFLFGLAACEQVLGLGEDRQPGDRSDPIADAGAPLHDVSVGASPDATQSQEAASDDAAAGGDAVDATPDAWVATAMEDGADADTGDAGDGDSTALADGEAAAPDADTGAPPNGDVGAEATEGGGDAEGGSVADAEGGSTADADGGASPDDAGVDGQTGADAGGSLFDDRFGPAVFLRKDGELDVAVETSDRSLGLFSGPSGAEWSTGHAFVRLSAPGTAFSQPSAAVRADGAQVDLVVVGAGGSLVHYTGTPGGSWASDTILSDAVNGETIAARPAIAIGPSGEIDVAALGSGHSLFYCSVLPSTGDGGAVPPWHCQYVAKGGYISAPALLGRDGEIDIAAVADDGSLHLYSGTPEYANVTWFSPYAFSVESVGLPGTFASAPTVATAAHGFVYVAARGALQSVQLVFGDPGAGWYSVAGSVGSASSAPAMFVRDSQEVDIVGAGVDGGISYIWGADALFYSAQLSVVESPAYPSLVADANAIVHVVATAPDGTFVYQWAAPGKAWAPTTFSIP